MSIIINVARDLTKFPGPRYRTQGSGSGEEFLTDHLRPAFLRAKQTGDKVTVQLDGVKYGYPTSFLEEAFGGLTREFGIDDVQETLVFESANEPLLDYEIRQYIKEANQVRGGESETVA